MFSPLERFRLIRHRFLTRAVPSVLACSALAACASLYRPGPPVARTSQQIANVFVSAYPEVPWAEIATQLSPNRNMSIADAQQIADNTTAAQNSLVSSLFAAGLGLNLPTTTRSRTITRGIGSPQTNSSTVQSSAGTPPTLAALPAPPALPGSSSTATALSPVDGSEMLVTSTALFQQAAIIDNQLNKQYLPEGYSAHLLTFQINIQPLSNNWSYDAFVDITLIPSPYSAAVTASADGRSGAGGLPPVIVKPLIITDALETASVQQSAEQIKQALAQLSGTIGSTGGALNVNAGTNSQNGTTAYDKNTLVTAGRVTDATIRVRLGAAYSGFPYPTLIPRTYNVSLFVLTRLDLTSNVGAAGEAADASGLSVDHTPSSMDGPSYNQLTAVTHTQFLPSKVVPTKFPLLSRAGKYVGDPGSARQIRRSRDLIAKRVRAVLRGYGYRSLASGCVGSVTDPDAEGMLLDADPLEAYLDLLRAIDRGDYPLVDTCLGLPEKLTAADEEMLYRLIAELSEVQVDSRYARLSIPLKDTTLKLPDEQQLAVVSDDDDLAQETVTLSGAENLSLDRIHPAALIEFPDGTRQWLLPTSMSFTDATMPTQLSIVFPSPQSLSPVVAAPAPVATAAAADPAATGPRLLGIEITVGAAATGRVPPSRAWYTHLARLNVPASATAGGGSASASASSSTGAASSSAPPPTPAVKACAATQKPLSTTTTVLHLGDNSTDPNSAQLNVALGDLTKLIANCAQVFGSTSLPTLVQPFTLTVSGAATVTPDGQCLATSGTAVQLKQNGQCVGTLALTGLTSEVPVTLTVTDENNVTVGTALSLRVLDASHPH